MLTNLLGNALTVPPPGGTVTVMQLTDGGTRVVVSDPGVGIAPADLERIFERFYRAPSARSSRRGTGVGLTIARGIARAYSSDLGSFASI